ncbi:hypothetical protein ACFV0L_41930 [Streptosporangium canum]|uniref:hypothetical protein n=1 Tax=Streptosporangium canum TaxID=324952 RepID=UPI0036987180
MPERYGEQDFLADQFVMAQPWPVEHLGGQAEVDLSPGDIDSVGGWAAVALAAVTAIGLALIAYRATGEPTRIERATDFGLGAGWRAAIDADLSIGLRHRPPLARILLLPIFRRRLRATSANPVVYAELRGGNHTFDLYHSVRFEAVIDAIEGFTAWVRSRERRASRDAR